eukprot:TRINITY_DN21874_c0_g1_i2.p1 TRINITY_DN21874_c0_g1~~TRINITY_DN21874_c0_g1_i2.p1  ORF type:complete len:468 (-),score=97.55 TRINITY_DN21874_c0_g1_i2:30-1433(-)
MFDIWCPDLAKPAQTAEVLVIEPTEAEASSSVVEEAGDRREPQLSVPLMQKLNSSSSGGSWRSTGKPTSHDMLAALEPVNRKTDEVIFDWVEETRQMLSALGGDKAPIQYQRPPPPAIFAQGGFGKVWKAVNKVTGDIVAVKNVDVRRSHGREGVAMNEFDISTCLHELQRVEHHPGIVRLLSVQMFHLTERQSLSVMVMEFCGGGTLQEAVQRNFDDDVYTRCGKEKLWLGQLFLAIEYLHGIDMLIRDLKPDNVVLDRPNGDFARLIDFGYGRLLTPSTTPRGGRYTFSVPPGTAGYLAPELVDQKPYDHAVDLYSLGVFMWVMLGGGQLDHKAMPPSVLHTGMWSGTYSELLEDSRLLANALNSEPQQCYLPLCEPELEVIRAMTRQDPGERPRQRELRAFAFFKALQLPAADADMAEVKAWRPPGLRTQTSLTRCEGPVCAPAQRSPGPRWLLGRRRRTRCGV